MLPKVERNRTTSWAKAFIGGAAAYVLLTGDAINYVAAAVLFAVLASEVKAYYDAYQKESKETAIPE